MPALAVQKGGRRLNSKPRILVVEDDFDIRDTLAQILEAEGYDVAGAANGAEALDVLANQTPPALILLDLMMPVMNGWQFRAEQLKDPQLASIPVVVISADSGVGQKAQAIGAADSLKKPVPLETLLNVVSRYAPLSDSSSEN